MTRARTHLGTTGRCSGPGWQELVGASGSGGRTDGRKRVGTRGCTLHPITPTRSPTSTETPPRPPNVLIPGAVVAPWGWRMPARAPSPAAPVAGHMCLLNHHLPAGPNDSRELIIPQPQEARGDIGVATLPGPCPSFAGTVSLAKVTWSIPGCSRPTSPAQCLQGDFVAPLEDSVAVAWPRPAAGVAAVTVVTRCPAGAPSPPFPADPLTELLRKMNFPARIP